MCRDWRLISIIFNDGAANACLFPPKSNFFLVQAVLHDVTDVDFFPHEIAFSDFDNFFDDRNDRRVSFTTFLR